MQAMPGGRTITIRVGSGPNGYLQIDLSDTGEGIKPEALEHIFDPFYTTKEVGKGTRLGLSVSFGIIAKHHGSISVKSEIGKGATFTILAVAVPADK